MKKYLLLFQIFILILKIHGKDYYWVNNGGDWSDVSNHWAKSSGGSTFHNQVPTSNDNVFFDENSFSLPNQIVIANETIEYCKNMDWSGVLHTPNFQISNELHIYGSLTFAPNMTSYASQSIYFKSDTLGNTITLSGVPLYNNVIFDGVGGEWTLIDSLQANNYGSNTNITVINGLLNSNGNAISAQKIITYESGFANLTGSNIYLGNANSSFSGTNNLTNTTIYLLGNPNNNGSFSSIAPVHNIVTNSVKQMTVGFSGTANKLIVGGNGPCLLSDNSSIDSVIVEPGKSLIIRSSKSLTVNNYLNSDGDCNNISSIKSSVNSTPATIISNSTVIVNSTSLQDVYASGEASFVANSSYDLGGNNGWTINQPSSKNYYWVGNSGNWSDFNHWSFSSGGVSSACSPGPNDNVFFDANSFSLDNQQVTLDLLAQCKNMDWSGVLHTPNFQISNELHIYGSLTFAPNMTSYASQSIYFKSDTLGNTITLSGVPLYNNVIFDGVGGEWTLIDSLQANNYGSNTNITVINGLLNSNGNAISAQKIITYESGFANLTGSNIYLGNANSSFSGTNNLTNTTIYLLGNPNNNGSFSSIAPVHNIVTNSVKQMTVGFSGTANKLIVGGNGPCLLSDNSSIDSVIVEPGAKLTLGAEKILYVGDFLYLSGSSEQPVELKSSISGLQAVLTQQSKENCFEFLYITDINAIGSSTYNVGVGSDDNGNNTGWNFDIDCSLINEPCQTTYSTDTRTTCDSLVWVDGLTYRSNNNTATYTYTTDEGCDSIVTLDLIIRNWNLVWSDEFDVNGAIDNSKWHHQTFMPNGWGWYNGELQHYTDRTDNSYVQDGNLHIVAKSETYTDPVQGVTKEYTSARLNSKFAFTYGRVEARAKLPFGIGTWPAIWTLGKNINETGAYWQTQGYGTTNWPACGEIDIMEHWGTNQNYVKCALHTPSSNGNTVNQAGIMVEDVENTFHLYAMEWSEDKIVFSVDGIEYYTYQPDPQNMNTWPFVDDQYILLNVAIASNIDPSFNQSDMVLDYIRVYEQDTTNCDTICNAPSNLAVNNINTNSADLSWIAGGSETVWELTYGQQGFAIGTGTLVPMLTSNSYNLTGLSSNTSYDFYVKADCGFSTGTTNLSTWTGPFTFATLSSSSGGPKTFIPDDNFEAYLENNGMGDGFPNNDSVLTENISGVAYLDVSNQDIIELTGIEAFVSLNSLICVNNLLTELDISQNFALRELNCRYNQISSLEVSQNTGLTSLVCNDNVLTSLDVSNNTSLEHLGCEDNELTSIDVSNNTALIYFICGDNQIASLDVSNNTALTYLGCHANLLTELDVSNNNALTVLSFGENQITGIDVSHLSGLTKFWCYSNALTCVNLKNGSNVNLSSFDAIDNPDLTCIEVDNPTWAEANWTYQNLNVDSIVTYSTNCGYSAGCFANSGGGGGGGGGGYSPGTVHCNGTPTAVVEVTNPITGKTWMDRNLGASRAATSSTDEEAYGDLYQWGRGADGHQCRNSNTTTTLSSTDQPGHGDFILSIQGDFDWRSPHNDNLWQGLSGTNNPCPSGYRLPTSAEWDAECLSWSSNSSAGAFPSTLKLPVAGSRGFNSDLLYDVGTLGHYWSGTANGHTNSDHLEIDSSGAYFLSYDHRAFGDAVRCIKD